MSDILKINDLNISFDKNSENEKIIVENASFSVGQGELVLIIGDNGAGKSTIFNALIFALDKNASSSFNMLFNGKAITKENKDDFRRAIGYSEQTVYDGSFFSEKVKQHIMEYAASASNNNDYEQYYDELFYKELRCDLYSDGKLNNKRIKVCSGGEKQMISILKAFSRNNADLYILDEPINNLDSRHARLLNNFIAKLKKRDNPPGILIVTHCQMFQNVDKAYKLKNGKLTLLDRYEPKSCFGECDECGLYKED